MKEREPLQVHPKFLQVDFLHRFSILIYPLLFLLDSENPVERC